MQLKSQASLREKSLYPPKLKSFYSELLLLKYLSVVHADKIVESLQKGLLMNDS